MGNIQAIIHKCEAPETGYWAEVPSLPGCVTQGETLDEVRAMIRDAVTGWFACAWELAMRDRKPELAKGDIMEPVFA
jgi:predicted RNase H-like HicB family nuclease